MNNTIKDKKQIEIIIKNSRFIAIAQPVKEANEISTLLKEAKDNYPKATHYTYAYILPNIEKSSDDGEPGGTAGIPILSILKAEEMTNILVIVIRYFGGIKLGTGGLVRDYKKACREVLSSTQTIKLVPAYKVQIEAAYNKGKELDHLLQNSIILEKKFTDKIVYLVLIEDPKILNNHFSYQVVEASFIEKEY